MQRQLFGIVLKGLKMRSFEKGATVVVESLPCERSVASLLFIYGMAFNSDDGKISRKNFRRGEVVSRPGQEGGGAGYYFVGRLTNDYASATFVKTKKTLSLNHKDPLPEARPSRIIYRGVAGSRTSVEFVYPFSVTFPPQICQVQRIMVWCLSCT